MPGQSPVETTRLEDIEGYLVPWTTQEAWIGVGMLVLIMILEVILVLKFRGSTYFESFGPILLESLYLLPVILILGRRRANWLRLGFRRFGADHIALGCGLIVGAYFLIIIHNSLLLLLGIHTQGTDLIRTFNALKSPVGFILVGVLAAPMVEEIFFRGFLFQGFRQRYGWNKAAIASSLVFALAHLQLVALIPTFLLGYVLSYVYHRSNSIWPGMILHFLVNAVGICAALVAIKYSHG
jgi:membrane protease YdiL (CAAX protease family)